jgi:transposase
MKRVVADSPRHDIFKLGLNVLVVNPSDVKRGDKRYQKTDALDSKKLVQSIKIRCSKRCFYSHRREQFTTLARHRTQVTKNQITYQKYVTVSWKVPDEFDNSN